jgi:hypothetical protein
LKEIRKITHMRGLVTSFTESPLYIQSFFRKPEGSLGDLNIDEKIILTAAYRNRLGYRLDSPGSG